jgi:hypothetical protein
MAYQYSKKELQELAEHNAKLSKHFAPGNILLSHYWKEYDLVLDFHPLTRHSAWYVRVIHCDASGKPIKDARPRTHYTYPDQRDIITGTINFY